MICAAYKELCIPEAIKSPNWDKALEWLKSDSWKNIPLGKTEIDGPNVFVLHSSNTTKLIKESRYESHRVYADIQLAIKGAEIIQVCFREGLKILEPYSEENDIDFLQGEPEFVHSVVLAYPLAAVLFPWDIHMPGIALDNKPAEVEKIVLKVAL